MDKTQLINFENWVVNEFNEGHLKSPVHLSGGNEEQLIKIFSKIKKEDWVFTTYRSHYHALLKGVPEQRLKDWILDNKSIHFMDSEYKIFSSAIVGGTLSIALGVAMSIKMNKEEGKVYCFIGDMTASLGAFYDVLRYAYFHELPITFIVEDNGLSTDTPTQEAWGCKNGEHLAHLRGMKMVKTYKYERKYPHYGTGKFVSKIWEGVDDTKKKGF